MHRIARPVVSAASRRTQRSMLQLPRVSYATSSKQPGPTSQFYKTFTRPVAKVLVLAVFTYQFIYWGWSKLEADEHQQRTNVEIAELEAQVNALDKARKMQVQKKNTEEEKEKEVASAEQKPKTGRWWWLW
ncbi:hypothetical protein E4U55_001611 [Claviceps digitariae]|nr:hypothetical protein E4U55_001611 [Claviceps digitariae]